jgi:ribonuclease-3 family protein
MLWKYPEEDASHLSPLALAYVGDAVFELFVRSSLAAGGAKVNRLHRGAVGLVSAPAMAGYYKRLEPHLTAPELELLHRGRNAKSRKSKSAGVSQYHMSTGFEALVGYLFLSRQESRLAELFTLLQGEETDERQTAP